MRSRLTGMTMPVLRPEVGTMKVNKSMRLTAAVTAVALLSGCGIFKGKSGPKTPVVGERIPILTAESSVKVDPSIADVQVVLPAPEPNGEWSQPGGYRKSVVWGKSVSVGVDLGGGRINKKT